jgi:hypothetical protein
MAKNNPQTITRTFTLEKETKNTYRFQEDDTPGHPPAIGTLYIQRYLFNGSKPDKITLTLEIGG